MHLSKLPFGLVLLGSMVLLIGASLTTSAQDTSVVTATPASTNTPTATTTLIPTATAQGSLFIRQIMDGADDVNESGSVFDIDKENLWIGNGDSLTDQYLALRFTNVAIPPGSTIHAAHLEVYATQDEWISLAYSLQAESADNSDPFTSDDPPSKRALTEAVVEHESNVQWLANRWYPLDDIGVVVQAVIDRPGWQSGNSLSIIATGSENGGNFARKFFSAFEADPLRAARLVIDVSPSAVTPAVAQFPTLTPNPCSGITLPTRLSVDHKGRVPADATQRVNVRPAPNISTPPSGQVKNGDSFNVLNGPVCADSVRWFQIRYGENNDKGWIAEGQNNVYFVEPVDG
ncbi:MAG: SH3 domain-containing protein [Chloroflexota bacterium]